MASQPQPTDQQLDLDTIETRANAATPGPWGAYTFGGDTLIEIAADLQETGTGYRARREICRLEDEPMDNDPTHREWTAEEDWAQVQADAEFVAHAREDVDALAREVRRLSAYVASLEPAAMHARAALAALCYDLDDPGTDALGALHLIQQATVGVERPKDDGAAALAQRDAEVMRRCAEFVRDTYSGDEADDAADTLERDADVVERGCRSEEGTARGLTNCPRCGRLSAKHPIPLGLDD